MGKKNDDELRRAIEESGASEEDRERMLRQLAQAQEDENRRFDDRDQGPSPN